MYINGDGETSRDFCYVDNAVQANLLAATTDNAEALNQVYNVAVAERTTLNELFELERALLVGAISACARVPPATTGNSGKATCVIHRPTSPKARNLLGYAPTHRVREGLKEAMGWYIRNLVASSLTAGCSGRRRPHGSRRILQAICMSWTLG